MTENIYGSLGSNERLDRALAVFIAQEIEHDDGANELTIVVASTLAAVTKTGTHSKEALRQSASRLLAPKKTKLIDRVDSKIKRIAILAFPFFAIVAMYRWAQDIDHYRWEPSLPFMLFTMASVFCLLIAFTKLGDWLQGDHL